MEENRRILYFNDISENFALVQLMATVGKINHTVSIYRSWTYYSNYKRELPLVKESFNVVCTPYKYMMACMQILKSFSTQSSM